MFSCWLCLFCFVCPVVVGDGFVLVVVVVCFARMVFVCFVCVMPHYYVFCVYVCRVCFGVCLFCVGL